MPPRMLRPYSRTVLYTLFLATTVTLATGCGNKGALYLDNDQEPVPEVAAPDALEDDDSMEFPRESEGGDGA